MNTDRGWCHDCDQPVGDLYIDFYRHAAQGHAITDARCPDDCQFTRAAS